MARKKFLLTGRDLEQDQAYKEEPSHPSSLIKRNVGDIFQFPVLDEKKDINISGQKQMPNAASKFSFPQKSTA